PAVARRLSRFVPIRRSLRFYFAPHLTDFRGPIAHRLEGSLFGPPKSAGGALAVQAPAGRRPRPSCDGRAADGQGGARIRPSYIVVCNTNPLWRPSLAQATKVGRFPHAGRKTGAAL